METHCYFCNRDVEYGHVSQQTRLYLSQTKIKALTSSKLKPTALGYIARIIILFLESQKETMQRKELAPSNGKLVEKLETDTSSLDFHKLVKLHPRKKGLSPILCFCQRNCANKFSFLISATADASTLTSKGTVPVCMASLRLSCGCPIDLPASGHTFPLPSLL